MQQCWRAQYHFDIFCSYQRGSAINMSELSLESKYSQLVQESDVWSADLFNYSITGDTPTSLGKALIMCQKGLNCSSCLYDVMAISCGQEFIYSFTDFALTRSHFSTSKQTSVIQKQSNHIPIHHKKINFKNGNGQGPRSRIWEHKASGSRCTVVLGNHLKRN